MGADTHFQVSPKIFDCIQVQAWTRTFTELSISHSCCVFMVIVLLEGEPSAQSEVLNALWILNLYILVHWAFLLLWWVPQSLPLKNSSTAWDCYQHTLLLGWYSAGDEQSRFPSNMMLGIEVHQTRESCFSESEGPLGAFLLILSVFSCVSTEERIEFGHTAIKPISMECCSDVCPSVDFSHLHIWSWSSTKVTIGFLVTTLTKEFRFRLLHQLLSLARSPALGRVLVVSNFFH